MPKVKKLPKWAIQQAGGINKKAWALARRGKGRKMAKAKPQKTPRRRSTPQSVGGGSTNNKKWGPGRWFKTGRTIDVFSGPAQGALGNRGLTKEGLEATAYRYTGGMSAGVFDKDVAKATAGGIGTGLLRNWIRSKMGIYRGMGQKKYLSFVQGANPEILATAETNPTDDLLLWNNQRSQYDRAYAPVQNVWDPNPQSGPGGRLLKSIGFDIAIGVTQKAAEKWLNPLLPPGHNL